MQDWSEIEASFQFDYGIDLSSTNMSIRRFLVLLSNLSDKTPVGRLIYIRNWKPQKHDKHEVNKHNSTMRALQREKRLVYGRRK